MAATATRPQNLSASNSRMSSPRDTKKTLAAVPKPEESTKVEAPAATQSSAAATTDQDSATDSKPAPEPATSNAQPLAPPPRPSQPSTSDAPDYFSTVHHPFNLEPNVFEQSFGGVDTPGGRTILPPVANITSPSPSLPGITPGWNSLRAGPLSPAMLTGPTQSDYFGDSFRGFPTPNESSLRTGLTPGGGGSMFPAASPSTQAFLNLASGGVTPSTADFQQSALRAAAVVASQTKFPTTTAPTSQPEAVTSGMERPSFSQPPAQPPQQARPQDMFGQHDVSTAANDLLSFATQNGPRNGQQPFAITSQPPPPTTNGVHMPVQPVNHDQSRRNTKGSINSVSISGSADTGDFSDSEGEQKTATRSRANTKKGGNAKQSAGSRRKAEETPKGGNKKSKANNGTARSVTAEEEDSDEGTSPKAPDTHADGRKMTDEEKRKNFLERNRVAALKCRQRKKQWLANLQQKVELFSQENDTLSAQVTQLREEIVNLKTLLLAHKDCPVAQAQGLNGVNMNTFLGELSHHQHPYGMGMGAPNGVQMGMPMQPGPHIQNRYDSPVQGIGGY